MMNVLIYLIALPVAVATLAALMSIRDGTLGSWALIRATLFLGALGSVIWMVGAHSLNAAAAAFGTVIGCHLLGFYVGRWFLTGIR